MRRRQSHFNRHTPSRARLSFSGIVSAALSLVAPAQAAVFSFANPAAMSIPEEGTASPYPSNIDVSGVTGSVTNVTVDVMGLTHSWPDDIDMLLVGPAGASTVLMSDVGGSDDISSITLTFDDGASAPLSDSTQILAGTYLPTNSGTDDSFPLPVPAGPYGETLSVFNNLDPNGTWSLFVLDDTFLDDGSIGLGWRLNFTTAVIPLPASVLLLGSALSGLAMWRRRSDWAPAA